MMQDIIHVVESKPTKRHGDYFLRQILKAFEHPFPVILFQSLHAQSLRSHLINLFSVLDV
jgi:hypothetical protein